MSFIDAMTPKDTEEIKPGFFIQKIAKGYRQVHPLAWSGKFRWKEQLKTIVTLRTMFTFAIIIFVAYAYIHDVQEYKDFYKNITSNPINFCMELDRVMTTDYCTPLHESRGLCVNLTTIKKGVNNSLIQGLNFS